ncbi:hypothetical protein AVDCRST_MAG94-6094 [uncultured Leptolyngbya sp.]|uniref:Uncharacterized protein n=1 Tax=uncultured Leptolyngbya sp. TaxID=332963 RepID=A0A6J4P766_9CYAN|nr:hypothetical protein AVDCRST_MAG94-6094 [uncultured Leptolyngbya sp.]
MVLESSRLSGRSRLQQPVVDPAFIADCCLLIAKCRSLNDC